MDEMTQVRQFRADVPSPDPADLGDVRHQLLRETKGTPPRGRLLRGLFRNETSGAPGRRRVAWRWGLAGGLAVVVAAGFVVAQQIATPPGSTENRPVAGASSEAVEVLYRAADYAAATPDLKVRDDQFVYVESKTMYQATIIHQHSSASYLYRSHRKIWQSVDGSKPGLLRSKGLPPVALPGRPLPPEAQQETRGDWQDTTLEPGAMSGYARDMPTDPDKMYAYIYRNLNGDNPRHQQAWTTVGDLLRERLLPPKARAALFKAAARIPGVTVVNDAVDAAGRHGIAVSATHHGVSQQIIFDKQTYQFLGERGVVVDSTKMAEKLPNGTVVASTAELRSVVVDKPGQEA